MPAKGHAPEPYRSTLQWSRRFTGLKAFMALASVGAEGYAKQIDHQSAMGDLLANQLSKAGWRVVHHSPLAVVCFSHPAVDSGRCTHRDVITHLYEERLAWASVTHLSHHGPVFRACITNYRTQPNHVQDLVQAMGRAVDRAVSLAKSGA